MSHRCKPYEDFFSFNRFPMVGFVWWVSKINATGFFLFFFTLYFLLLYSERPFVNLYILSFMKAHRLQRNFSEGKRPKRANRMLMPAYFIYKEIGSKFTVLFILESSRRKQCHMHSSQPELQRFNAIISWKTHQGSVLIIFLKVS